MTGGLGVHCIRVCSGLCKGGLFLPQLYTKKAGTSRGKQLFKPDENKYIYNIDTFWFNCRSYFYQEVMDSGLRDFLDDGRSYKTDNHDAIKIDLKIPDYDNEISFEVMSGNPPMYQYSLRNDSMAIYFRKNEHAEGALMRVQINQFVLWEKGFERAYKESLEVIKALGFLPYDMKINRVDFAVHSDQFKWVYDDMKTFQYPRNIANDNWPNFIKLNPMTGEFETFYVGDRSRLFLRIYDKSKEIKAKKKYYFNDIYNNYDMDVNNVWNIEIEVRRPYLKELEDEKLKKIFDDVDYCIENNGLSRLWSHLLEKYHHDSAHWTVLKKGDSKKFEHIKDYKLNIEKDIDANFERELNQIAGRMMMGVIDDDDYSFDRAMEVFKKRYLESKEGEDKKLEWLEKVEKKKSLIQNYRINKSIKTEEMRVKNYFDDLKKDKQLNENESIYIENKKRSTLK